MTFNFLYKEDHILLIQKIEAESWLDAMVIWSDFSANKKVKLYAITRDDCEWEIQRTLDKVRITLQ